MLLSSKDLSRWEEEPEEWINEEEAERWEFELRVSFLFSMLFEKKRGTVC